MVGCPKCGNTMDYVATDCEATSTKEKIVVIDATARYVCRSCYSKAQLRYTVEVVLK